ncbi:MAG: ABC transporter ATP-binding protein [Planctomycetota bacterium]|jgi:ABC-2 type transport system ATP-binding protein
MSIVSCKGVTKFYGKKLAVDNIDLELNEHDIFGLIGPNGAGKSTLIKMMTGLVFPTEGNITIQGYDVSDDHLKAMKNIGAIIEWPAFIPYLTARQNLHILSGGSGSEFDKKMNHVVDFVNMLPNLDKRVECFSTGMKQRLGIALALLPDSKFVILDEPTNGLDPNGIVEIRNILRDYNEQYGTTILLSSHLLNEVEQICSKIAIIHNGKIVAFGKIADLLQSRETISLLAEPFDKSLELLKNARQEGKLPIDKIIDNKPEIKLEVTDKCSADINDLLVKNNCRVSQISINKMQLEDFFAEITEGKTDVA